ncbi:hypothetical protein JZ751_014760 [Albula glossodonta]|uniref:Uncharacterized protein n=1 Tax=Albula glossodonta TaxID=121402 RepID=A0A8T2N4P2_9TELE|nr:hypothetical protein JZ751_014760 [Albula glossodonta]
MGSLPLKERKTRGAESGSDWDPRVHTARKRRVRADHRLSANMALKALTQQEQVCSPQTADREARSPRHLDFCVMESPVQMTDLETVTSWTLALTSCLAMVDGGGEKRQSAICHLRKKEEGKIISVTQHHGKLAFRVDPPPAGSCRPSTT